MVTTVLHVPAAGGLGALLLRPWLAADMPALVAEMGFEYPTAGLRSRADATPPRPTLPAGAQQWTGPTGERDAARWLAGQDRGWRDGDWLTFAVLAADGDGGYVLAGHVAFENRLDGGRVGERETGEIHYWTAVAARGRGVAPAAVRAVTGWAFDAFGASSLRQVMVVHDLGNAASCRVAEKAGYPFKELSPAKPPLWFTDGHIHMRRRGDSGGRPPGLALPG
jgi:RimJ/RimL family protein N-acetyltransferase